jgi:hypothetical protein
VSLSINAQYFADDFSGDDSGYYLLVGATAYKELGLTSRVDLYPFLGFSLAAESYTFGGGDPDRDAYLTRNLGFTLTAALDDAKATRIQLIVEEHSFRRETYRAARAGFVRRF